MPPRTIQKQVNMQFQRWLNENIKNKTQNDDDHEKRELFAIIHWWI